MLVDERGNRYHQRRPRWSQECSRVCTRWCLLAHLGLRLGQEGTPTATQATGDRMARVVASVTRVPLVLVVTEAAVGMDATDVVEAVAWVVEAVAQSSAKSREVDC